MKIKTTITEMLGIDLPIIGAPMFLVSYPDLVVAVSEAGGIGCFPSLNYRTLPELRDGLAEIRDRTSKPIGVNIILHKDHNPNWSKQLEACLDAKVELIITSLGTPKSVVKEAKSVGAKVFGDVTTLRHARLIEKAGADAIIAVAHGAGGHAGNITPFSLLPELKKELSIPVIASGAISSGKQMAASLSLGADAVYVGTKLIATPEAAAQNEYKQMLIDSRSTDIVYTPEISGIPANWLKPSLDKIDYDLSEQSHDLASEYKRWKDIWSAGQGVSQISDIEPAADIITGIAKEYLDICDSLPRAEVARV